MSGCTWAEIGEALGVTPHIGPLSIWEPSSTQLREILRGFDTWTIQ